MDIVEARNLHEKDLLALPGVTGVDVGLKWVGNEMTDQLAIRVFVKSKGDRPDGELIPSEIDGFPTDVIEASFQLQQLPDARRLDPLVGGLSIGSCRIGGSGTLGVIVLDATDNPLALSNFHVLCGTDLTHQIGDDIVQPGTGDNGDCSSDVIGTLVEFLGPDQDDRIDAAASTIAGRGATCGAIEDMGAFAGKRVVQFANELPVPVQKRGRTTGLTFGFIDGIHATVVDVDYGGAMGLRTLRDQLSIGVDKSLSAAFSQPGDSGSVIVTRSERQVVGLLFSGDKAPNPLRSSANRIDFVLDALSVRLCTRDLPEILSVAPASGSRGGGEAIVLTGTDFDGATAVGFGAAGSAPNFTIDSPTQLTVETPAGTGLAVGAGTVNVTVTTPHGASRSVPTATFTYADPVVIGAVLPPAGQGTGGTPVTINGLGLSNATTVKFGGTDAVFQNVSEFQITAVTPPGTGLVGVQVATPGGVNPAGPPALFNYLPPRVDSLSISQGSEAGGDPMTITGVGFEGATSVLFEGPNGTETAFPTVFSDTEIFITTPEGTGVVDVRVEGQGGTSEASPFGVHSFTYVP